MERFQDRAVETVDRRAFRVALRELPGEVGRPSQIAGFDRSHDVATEWVLERGIFLLEGTFDRRLYQLLRRRQFFEQVVNRGLLGVDTAEQNAETEKRSAPGQSAGGENHPAIMWLSGLRQQREFHPTALAGSI